MFHDAPNINYLFAGLLVEELVRHGVEWFVISPGSRSAPLAWTVASHPRAKHVVHFDERGAAFHALGIAKATLKPAAFISTSGTAAANALPAAVEASYSGIPLVLITADRPERLQGSGSNQTINQHGLYREFVRHESNFAVDPAGFDPVAVLTEIDRAVADATALWPGPIHFNCQMDEPLAPEKSEAYKSEDLLRSISRWLNNRLVFTERVQDRVTVDPAVSRVQELLSRLEPGIIVVGQLSGPQERDEIHEVLEHLQWPFIPDITSGMRLGPPLPWSLSYANHYAEELVQHAKTVIHLGGPITSRRVLDPLSRFDTRRGNRELVRITQAPGKLDPFGNATLRVHASASILRELSTGSGTTSPLNSWPDSLLNRESRIYEAIAASLALMDVPTELGTVLSLTMAGVCGATIFAGNSMPIRDLDLYGQINLKQNSWVVANRGASGIDGNVATAAGHARATGEPVVALLGDLAVLHDLNSLALLRDLSAPVVLVVMNNDGGGIFSFLPIAKHPEHFERLFGTPHGIGFAQAATMFGLDYCRPEANMDIASCTVEAIDNRRSCIIEVASNRAENVRQHQALDARIRAALDKA
jgi:2-succinyl-5-enolpyruvyl-6-hydroxy-3-cyclohexene-1-carboxylate synthase